jgi:hypothetical protein
MRLRPDATPAPRPAAVDTGVAGGGAALADGAGAGVRLDAARGGRVTEMSSPTHAPYRVSASCGR